MTYGVGWRNALCLCWRLASVIHINPSRVLSSKSSWEITRCCDFDMLGFLPPCAFLYAAWPTAMVSQASIMKWIDMRCIRSIAAVNNMSEVVGVKEGWNFLRISCHCLCMSLIFLISLFIIISRILSLCSCLSCLSAYRAHLHILLPILLPILHVCLICRVVCYFRKR